MTIWCGYASNSIGKVVLAFYSQIMIFSLFWVGNIYVVLLTAAAVLTLIAFSAFSLSRSKREVIRNPKCFNWPPNFSPDFHAQHYHIRTRTSLAQWVKKWKIVNLTLNSKIYVFLKKNLHSWSPLRTLHSKNFKKC